MWYSPTTNITFSYTTLFKKIIDDKPYYIIYLIIEYNYIDTYETLSVRKLEYFDVTAGG